MNTQEGVTKVLRQLRFNSDEEIYDKLVLEYLIESIKNRKRGKNIKPVKKSAAVIPNELSEAFKKNSQLKKGFDQLALFKQREYCEYISKAKRETTKITRCNNSLKMS